MLKQLLFIIIFSFIYYLQLDTMLNKQSCSKSLVTLLDSGKPHSYIIASTKAGETTVDKIGGYVTLEGNQAPSQIKIMAKDELDRCFGDVLKSAPKDPISYTFYLKSHKLELTKESKNNLPELFQAIKKSRPCVVDIICHTDTVGSSEINNRVSKKRADYVKKLIAEQNLTETILNAKGYGEEDLQVITPDNTDEARNRNIEIFIK